MKEYKLSNKSKVINLGFPGPKVVAKYKGFIQTILGLVVLLFFFNFFTIKCNDTKLVSVTGFNLVLGTNVSNQIDENLKSFADYQSFDEKGNMNNPDMIAEKEAVATITPNFFAILAFGLTVGTIICFALNFKYRNLVAVIFLTITLLSLLVVRLSFLGNIIGDSNEIMHITVTSSLTFWLVLFFIANMLYLSYLRWKYEM